MVTVMLTVFGGERPGFNRGGRARVLLKPMNDVETSGSPTAYKASFSQDVSLKLFLGSLFTHRFAF